MDGKQLIYYEQIQSKVYWKYSSIFKDDVDIIKISDIKREFGKCYGSNQYIMGFIEMLKEKIIKKTS